MHMIELYICEIKGINWVNQQILKADTTKEIQKAMDVFKCHLFRWKLARYGH